MTCREAVQEVFENEKGILTTNEVIDRIYAKYPDQPWKRNTISAELIGLSVNHPSSIHHPSTRQHAFLFSLGNGRYRCWDRERDGIWIVTDAGVQLADDSKDMLDLEEENEMGFPATGMSLSLERDMERSLIANLEQLEPGLKLYKSKGIAGHQVDTGVVGRLDILAIDNQGNYVVIELKAGEADDKVCGQILRYMGWVKRELANGKSVRGIIVASDFHKRVKYAVEAMPNVTLKRYEVHFVFIDV